jgi:hypothetical protein
VEACPFAVFVGYFTINPKLKCQTFSTLKLHASSSVKCESGKVSFVALQAATRTLKIGDMEYMLRPWNPGAPEFVSLCLIPVVFSHLHSLFCSLCTFCFFLCVFLPCLFFYSFL